MRKVLRWGLALGLWMGIGGVFWAFSPVHAEIGFSGATWGELRHEMGEGEPNTLLYGWIDQGVDWWELRGMRLSTYVILRYGLDTQGFDWNNYLAPGVGVAMRRGAVKLGLEGYREFSLKSGATENKAILYMNWWVGWDLGRR